MNFIKNKPDKVLHTYTDRELVTAILSETNRKLQRNLQEELYGRYAERVYFRCATLVKDDNEAKDLTHDILIKVFLKLGTFKGTAQLATWIMRITYNHCMTHLQKKKKRRTSDFEDVEYDIAYDDSGLEEKVLKEMQLAQLEKVFDQIKTEDKMLLLMYYKDGLSIKHISASLEIGESAAKMRLKRSRERLVKLIEKLKN